MTFPRQQQPRPTNAHTPVPYRAQHPAPYTGRPQPDERIVVVQLPAGHQLAEQHEPTAADIAAVRGAVRRDATFFVLLLAGVMLAVASLAGLRWAANATTPAPVPTSPDTASTGR
ncbi:hypothetical protein [Kitasatospora sp. MBT63]|uniref:hypothetical protein n=1 Tax=Kitasatospora sp. MBT63 TaxID=1444768 RepID=UPI00053A281D|nr:hypothetical protein [Kitasatospora sp. MBT63]